MESAFRYADLNNSVQSSARRCRLLYVVGQLGTGGSERQVYLLLKSMDREVYRPHVAVWNFNPEHTYVSQIRSLGVPLHSFASGSNSVEKMFAFRRLVFELNPELIHSYSFYTNIAAWWATIGTKIIAIGTVRSNFIHDRRSCGILLGSLCARWPRNQVFNNFASAEAARKSHTPFVPKRVFVVRNRIDLVTFPKTPVPSHGNVRILGIGSLFHCKRWDRLLHAAARLKRSGYDFSVEIVGDGPLRTWLAHQAQDLNVADRVKFVGYADDISNRLARSTFVAHTSDLEGCPNVVMEAMACGRAVVATDAGDTRSLVDDGDTGFVVRRGDDAALTERLARMIEDRDLCRRMGTAGRSKAEREFGLNRLVEETIPVYHAAGWKES
jgi:glycosyltransferase involved in cell wall biosynthesis